MKLIGLVLVGALVACGGTDSDSVDPHAQADSCGEPVVILGQTIPPAEQCEVACVDPNSTELDEMQCTTAAGVHGGLFEYQGIYGACIFSQDGKVITFDECIDTPAPRM